MTSVTACQTTERIVSITPPAELLEPCVKREVRMETNGDLVVAYAIRDFDLDVCNADKAALRAWRDSVAPQ